MNEAPGWLRWAERAIAALGLAVVVWSLITGWDAVVHAHPAYPVALGVTAVVAVVVLVRSFARRPARPGWRRAVRIITAVLGLLWVAALAWLRPAVAIEPALGAMESDAAVEVTESPTAIVLTPTAGHEGAGVVFQPGALVDARAYAAILRPLAESGHTVVIAKQPFGVAFFSLGALATAQAAHPEVPRWVAGGHSLGGVVASIEADWADEDAAPAVGLLLFASYPAGDVSATLDASVLSISGTEDGLSTPEDIEGSRDSLPEEAEFVVIDGASHAQFGDYGPQAGDGTPTISDDAARTAISAEALEFVAAQ